MTELVHCQAVIVERAADAREQEMQRAILDKEGDMHKSKLRLIQLCRELDTDGSGRICEEEFLGGFENNPEFAAALLGIGVYPEDISLLFEVLDTDGTGGWVTYGSVGWGTSNCKRHRCCDADGVDGVGSGMLMYTSNCKHHRCCGGGGVG